MTVFVKQALLGGQRPPRLVFDLTKQMVKRVRKNGVLAAHTEDRQIALVSIADAKSSPLAKSISTVGPVVLNP